MTIARHWRYFVVNGRAYGDRESYCPPLNTTQRARLRLRQLSCFVLVSFLLCPLANAVTSHCYEWEITTSWYSTGYVNSGEAACELVRVWAASSDLNMNRLIYDQNTKTTYRNIVVKAKTQVPGEWPSYGCYFSYEYKGTGQSPTPPTWTANSSPVKLVSTGYRHNPAGCKVFVTRNPPAGATCGESCNTVGDPIEPNSGSILYSTRDSADVHGLEFRRFYRSSSAPGMLGGWRYSYSRSIKTINSSSSFRAFSSGSGNSSLYTTENAACTSGFAEIKNSVPGWAGATASYTNRQCVISVPGAPAAHLELLYQSQPTPAPGSTFVIGYKAIRDDGQELNFAVNAGVISPPAGSTFKLEKITPGFRIVTSNDNMELYDDAGRLISITTRSGAITTMSYDLLGRLALVSDYSGHRLQLHYDANNRLVSISR